MKKPFQSITVVLRINEMMKKNGIKSTERESKTISVNHIVDENI